jgi:hypothetical protein
LIVAIDRGVRIAGAKNFRPALERINGRIEMLPDAGPPRFRFSALARDTRASSILARDTVALVLGRRRDSEEGL